MPSVYWKIVALADGRMNGFIVDQATGRELDLCLARVQPGDIVLRSCLVLFPDKLDAETGALTGRSGVRRPCRPLSPTARYLTRDDHGLSDL
jgi:endonuclease G